MPADRPHRLAHSACPHSNTPSNPEVGYSTTWPHSRLARFWGLIPARVVGTKTHCRTTQAGIPLQPPSPKAARTGCRVTPTQMSESGFSLLLRPRAKRVMESAKGLKGSAFFPRDHRHELIEDAEAGSEVRFRIEPDVDLSEAINLARCHILWKFCYWISPGESNEFG